MFTKDCAPPTTLSASNPDKRSAGVLTGATRGGYFSTRRLIAAMWAGVVPQQPPTILTSPSRAKVSKMAAVSSGPSGNPVGERGLGNPALG